METGQRRNRLPLMHVNGEIRVGFGFRAAPDGKFGSDPDFQRPTIASTSALRKRSTTSMKAIDGTSSSSAVIDAIW
jgi:hypothetical protein